MSITGSNLILNSDDCMGESEDVSGYAFSLLPHQLLFLLVLLLQDIQSLFLLPLEKLPELLKLLSYLLLSGLRLVLAHTKIKIIT